MAAPGLSGWNKRRFITPQDFRDQKSLHVQRSPSGIQVTEGLVWRVQDGFIPRSAIWRMPGTLGSAGSVSRTIGTHGLASRAASESPDRTQAARGSEGECSGKQGERGVTSCHPASEVTQHRPCCALGLKWSQAHSDLRGGTRTPLLHGEMSKRFQPGFTITAVDVLSKQGRKTVCLNACQEALGIRSG